jgi:organic hydroperoxide reductase OsmC/OhrA
MMKYEHHYQLTNLWKGNTGSGTGSVTGYSRDHTVSFKGKPELHLTTDNAKVGDPSKLNPEDLLVAAVSSCHMLSYLYLCALEGVVIVDYVDEASGTMIEKPEGGGSFKEIILKPVFTVKEASMMEKAMQLHEKAHEICYIANSVNFKVIHQPRCQLSGQ